MPTVTPAKSIEGVFSLIPPFVIEKETPVAHRDCYPAFLTTQPPFQEKERWKIIPQSIDRSARKNIAVLALT